MGLHSHPVDFKVTYSKTKNSWFDSNITLLSDASMVDTHVT
jgi:hypothetical protein